MQLRKIKFEIGIKYEINTNLPLARAQQFKSVKRDFSIEFSLWMEHPTRLEYLTCLALEKRMQTTVRSLASTLVGAFETLTMWSKLMNFLRVALSSSFLGLGSSNTPVGHFFLTLSS